MKTFSTLALTVAVLFLAGCPKPTPPNTNPCDPNPCGPRGTCTAVVDQPFCLCAAGSSLQNNTCVELPDLCMPNPCGAGRTCSAVDGGAQCACPAGQIEQNGACVSAACATLNCGTVPHQTVCSIINDTPTCTCEPGYVPTATGCSAVPIYDCAAAHTGNGADSHEPNECPTQATALTFGLVQANSIAPTGDVDWFSFEGTAGHVVEIRVRNASTAMSIDLYKNDGTTALASDHSGALDPTLRFTLPASNLNPLYVRVAPLDGSMVSLYDVAVQDLGSDDFADTITAASFKSLGQAFSGSIQFDGDVDVVGYTVTQGQPIRFERAATTPSGIEIDVLASNGTTVLTTLNDFGPASTVRINGSGSSQLYLRARGSVGAFSVSNSLVSDDFGDDVSSATPVTLTGTDTDGHWERAGDVDVVRFTSTAGRFYAVSCASASGCRIAILSSTGTVLANNAAAASANVAFQPSTAGTYYVSFTPYLGNAVDDYAFNIVDTGNDDVGDTDGTALPIALGTPRSASLQTSSDHDVFRFQGQALHHYDITCSSTVSYLCAMAVRDSNGASLGSIGYGYGSPVTLSITAGSDGPVFVDVSGSYYTGAYTLTVTDAGTDDHGNTAASGTAISVGSSTSGTIQFAGDVDAFTFSATAGTLYSARCTTSVSSLCVITVRDPSGTVVGTSSYGASTTVSFSASSSGTYSVEIASYSSSSTGAYSVSVSTAGSDDFGNTPATATPITVGNTVTGSTQFSLDKDVMSFSVTAQHVYTVTCTTSSSYLCALVVRDASNTTVASAGYGTSTTATFVAASSGTFTVETGPAYASYTGAWSLRVMDSGTDDFGDTAANATAVTVGSTVTGSIQFSNDKDVVSFTATASHIYKATCTTTATYLCKLTVRDAGGSTVTSTSYGTSTSATFVASSAGTYTVETAPYYSGYTGQWSMVVSDVGTDDHGDTPGTATGVTVGTATAGDIQFSGDKDVFSVSTTLNRLYSVACTSSVSYQCVMTVRDAAGTTVVTSSYGTSVTATFKASLAGPYTVEVKNYSTYTGAYSVTVNDAGVDDHGDTAATGTLLTVGASATAGSLEVGSDKDVFTFDATAGSIYRFACNTTASYLCVLSAKSPTGTTLVTSSYGTGTNVTFKAAVTGRHSVEVGGYYSSTYVGAYSVLVSTVSDDHGDTPGTATALTLGATKTGNLDYTTDVDYFAVSLVAGTTYTVTLAPTTVGFVVYDPGLGQVTLSNRTFTAASSGTYYVRVAATASSTGPYSVLVQ